MSERWLVLTVLASLCLTFTASTWSFATEGNDGAVHLQSFEELQQGLSVLEQCLQRAIELRDRRGYRALIDAGRDREGEALWGADGGGSRLVSWRRGHHMFGGGLIGYHTADGANEEAMFQALRRLQTAAPLQIRFEGLARELPASVRDCCRALAHGSVFGRNAWARAMLELDARLVLVHATRMRIQSLVSQGTMDAGVLPVEPLRGSQAAGAGTPGDGTAGLLGIVPPAQDAPAPATAVGTAAPDRTVEDFRSQFYHRVQRGSTVSQLVERVLRQAGLSRSDRLRFLYEYGGVDAIARLNGYADPDLIAPGTELYIPAVPSGLRGEALRQWVADIRADGPVGTVDGSPFNGAELQVRAAQVARQGGTIARRFVRNMDPVAAVRLMSDREWVDASLQRLDRIWSTLNVIGRNPGAGNLDERYLRLQGATSALIQAMRGYDGREERATILAGAMSDYRAVYGN